MRYIPKHLSREEHRRRQRAEAWIKGLAAVTLILCAGIALGWLL